VITPLTASESVVLDEDELLAIERIVEAEDPLDSPYSEISQYLLFDPINTSFVPPPDPLRPGVLRDFWASADVGITLDGRICILAPDLFISMDVKRPENWQKNRAYHLRKFKVPEIVVEVVSNDEGNELTTRPVQYAEWRIKYYAVFDPAGFLGEPKLYTFQLRGGKYEPMDVPFFPELGIGLTPWTGKFGGMHATFVRWCDAEGNILKAGIEKAAEEARRADDNQLRANWAEERAAEERRRAEEAERKLADLEQQAKSAEQKAASAEQEAANLRALLRKLGVDPDAQ